MKWMWMGDGSSGKRIRILKRTHMHQRRNSFTHCFFVCSNNLNKEILKLNFSFFFFIFVLHYQKKAVYFFLWKDLFWECILLSALNLEHFVIERFFCPITLELCVCGSSWCSSHFGTPLVKRLCVFTVTERRRRRRPMEPTKAWWVRLKVRLGAPSLLLLFICFVSSLLSKPPNRPLHWSPW